MTIWKFPLEVTSYQILRAPEGARPLKVMVQRGTACLWMMVAPDGNPTEYVVKIFGIGENFWDVSGDNYVDSFLLHDGALVFHVFLLTPTALRGTP